MNITNSISGMLKAVIANPALNPTGYSGACVVMKMLEDTKLAQFPSPSWIAVPNERLK